MSQLSQLYLPGALTMWCALIFALASIWGYSLLLRGDAGARAFARQAYRFFVLSIVLGAVVMVVALLTRDFRIEYVYQYSGLELPWHYQLAAFWAGQKGSFLIWLFWGALLGLPLMKTCGRHEPSVMGIYTLTLLGLLFILVRENPFVMLQETPVDGAGLNPLLQDDWMVIHPPIMFVGYAAAAIPFAFAMAALWRRDYDEWAGRAFPWALGGFLVLGTAILMGGYWAYKTLGWGGYWGWDPVENASLIPWLFGTVLIHGLYMERTKGRYRRVNYVLASLVYLSVLYGTFLTRSGVLADFSVHSFVDLGISGWLIALMAFFILLSVYLMVTRLRQVPTQANEDPLLSRGTFLVLATIAITVSAILITVGTSAPLLTWFMENPGQVGPAFYNRVNLPIALLIAFLVGLIPFLGWRPQSPQEIGRRLWPGAAFALLAAVVGALLGVHAPFHLLLVFLAALALATNLQVAVAKARGRGLRRAGGYLAHVGVGCMLLGFIASSAYDHSAKVTLEQGVPKEVNGMTLTFTRFIPRTPKARERMEVEVQRPDGSRYFAYPKFFVNDRTRQVMANPHIKKFPTMDLYISPIEFDPGDAGSSSQRIQLAKGQSSDLGDLEVRFVGFDLNIDGNALARMESGGTVTIGAMLDVIQNGQSERIVPLYRFAADRSVETPPTALPGGGQIRVSGINAAAGAVQLDLRGLRAAAKAGAPARLAVDVTRKPLINLVWYGFYIVLAGGALSSLNRLRQIKVLEAVKGGKKSGA